MVNKKPAATLPALKDSYDERSKYDWNTIRNDYIFGFKDNAGTLVYPKPKDLEDRHSVPAQYISNRATKEKWMKHREAHQNEVAIAQHKEHQKRLANKAVKFDEQAATDASMTQEILGSRIRTMMMLTIVDNNRIEEIVEEINNGREIDSELRAELKPLVSTYEYEAIWKAYTLANEVGRKALGITDDKQNITQTNVQINQVSPSAALKEIDDLRNQKLLEAFKNANMKIPGITTGHEEDIEDAEIVDDDARPELTVSAEDSGQIYDPHSASGSADSTEPE